MKDKFSDDQIKQIEAAIAAVSTLSTGGGTMVFDPQRIIAELQRPAYEPKEGEVYHDVLSDLPIQHVTYIEPGRDIRPLSTKESGATPLIEALEFYAKSINAGFANSAKEALAKWKGDRNE